MEVSVVLCTYSIDMIEHFREAAESVLGQSYDSVELVVVVDGSTSVYERVEDMYGGRSDVLLHRNENNQGLLQSRNTGAKLAGGDIVGFIDDDAVADEKWVERLVQTYEDSEAIAVGGKMTPEWVAGKPVYLPQEFYWLVGVTHRGFADAPGEVRNTNGSNLSFQRDVFLSLDGFDPEIGGRKGDTNLQGGETELCARMQAEYGQGVMYNPAAEVDHKIFAYRTRVPWLLDRALWQGYSKRVMAALSPEDTGNELEEENDFARRLLFDFVPHRIRNLIKSPNLEEFLQLLALISFTGTVGIGYLYGTIKW